VILLTDFFTIRRLTLSLPKQLDEASVPIPPPMVHNPDALFAKEFCDFLSNLETALYGCERAIA
jgi:hypothetical protein